MAQSSGNVSNIVSFGGVDNTSNLTIPEANSQGYFAVTAIILGTNAATTCAPFYKNGVLYQVTSGKTAQVVRINAIVTATGPGPFQLISATATFAVGATNASLTGAVYEGGATGNYVHTTVLNTPTTLSMPYSFTSLTWPGVQIGSASGTSVVTLILKEV